MDDFQKTNLDDFQKPTWMTSIRLPQLDTTRVWRLDGGEGHILMLKNMMMTMIMEMMMTVA